MPVIENVLVEVFNVVRRAVELEGRALEAGDSSSTTASSTPSSTATAAATTSSSSSSSGGPTSSPLLFFVALGFGVVFTNLWIIVGVKYCFRYNARNRAMRQNEDGTPIDMQAMPRPHRRRREKKLMTMEEVNERFPMTKYKNWVVSRQSEGLPSAGGVTAPPSRAGSVVDAEGTIVPSLPSSPTTAKPGVDGRQSADGRPATATTQHEDGSEITEIPTATDSESTFDKSDGKNPAVVTLPTLEEVKTATSTIDPKHIATVEDDEEEEEDHIHTAVPPELLNNPGDSCAICIDTLEDDDDIRGLTCGHAFHAGCLDPWLTSRRACCPLCKADYYTPKPRPEGEPAEPERTARRQGSRRNMQQQSSWSGIRGAPLRGTRMVLPGRFMTNPLYPGDGYGFSSERHQRRHQRAANADRADRARVQARVATQNAAPGHGPNNTPGTWRPANPFSNMRMPRFGRGAAAQETTPAQLEAGTTAATHPVT